MNPLSLARRLKLDPYILAILCMVGLASLLPARGIATEGLGYLTKIAIGCLFFLHGARLPRETVLGGLRNWRLHVVVLAFTFLMFPIIGFGITHLPTVVLPAVFSSGMLFLTCLPSTVQSSIAFTSIARGNIAGAIVSASASNLIGIFITPLLVSFLMGQSGAEVSLEAAGRIVMQLLLPFIAGQIARLWMAEWAARQKKMLGLFDRGTILLVVYSAFSEAVVGGIWHTINVADFGRLLLVCVVFLAAVLTVTTLAARWLGFAKADEIAIVFCGSKKSLASGVPMAGILFPGAAVGVVILPLMLFHQVQLMACAMLAQRYATRSKDDPARANTEVVV
ncbi:bile acid:sodium symporter family protein [Sphingobium sp. HWE2-09]|uniref:bile acid:sodium symporter family protein n=1 Tax=Sphingobium sp. HWE2-09 TaxID=3108390 RepID=UPI002DC8AF68|nr:bile acid:sodium symporter family protein [Sphingobium sp. HWE2-09]